MRNTLCVVTFAMSAAFGLAPRAAAQPVAPPTIQSVTLQPDTGVLTITGTSFGADLMVIVDGQPVTVLPGATATQVEVAAPATILTTPGTYRLTVVDPVRQIGDAFVVASQPATIGLGSTTFNGAATASSELARVPIGPTAVGPAANRIPRSVAGPSPMTVREDLGYPFLTSIGTFALSNNTTGTHNTASGFQALLFNTTGSFNTANGVNALLSNTTGYANTSIGYQALFSNTDGPYNTAIGHEALYSNTSGTNNMASGTHTLFYNTTGSDNTASGSNALVSNTTGGGNTASGTSALYSNTVGAGNTAAGYHALSANIGGAFNTASGAYTLYRNTIGNYNTGVGSGALYYQTSGTYNAALGYGAGLNATTGSHNLFLGALVWGTDTDTNTIRIGLPYDGGTGVGQNRTFIAGIRGTQLTGSAVQVFIDANGQLGTLTPPVLTGTLTVPVSLQQQLHNQREQLRDQLAVNADLRARLAKVEALLARLAAGKQMDTP